MDRKQKKILHVVLLVIGILTLIPGAYLMWRAKIDWDVQIIQVASEAISKPVYLTTNRILGTILSLIGVVSFSFGLDYKWYK